VLASPSGGCQTAGSDRTASYGAPVAGKVELLERTLAWRVAVLPTVLEVRQRGLRVQIRLAARPGEQVGQLVALAARRRGVAVRATRNAVVLEPPRSVSDAELRRLVAVLASSIAEGALARMPVAA